MSTAREAWIIDGVRTPRGKGKPNGALHGVHPQELLAQCLNALSARAGVAPDLVEDVIVGNGNSVGDHAVVHRPALGTGGGVACGDPGLHAQPLLRQRPAGGNARRHGNPLRYAGCRRRWGRGVDVALAGR